MRSRFRFDRWQRGARGRRGLRAAEVRRLCWQAVAPFAQPLQFLIWINAGRSHQPQTAVTCGTFGVSAAHSGTSLFEELGGVAGITRLVARFYDRVLADPALSPYFENVALDKLRRMQFEFFSAALGAPTRYRGRSITEAHAGRRISGPHFAAFVAHLAETLQEYPLGEDKRQAILFRVNAYAADVVKPATDA